MRLFTGARAELSHIQQDPTANSVTVDRSSWEYDGLTWRLRDYAGIRRDSMYAKDLPRPLPLELIAAMVRFRQRMRRQQRSDIRMV